MSNRSFYLKKRTFFLKKGFFGILRKPEKRHIINQYKHHKKDLFLKTNDFIKRALIFRLHQEKRLLLTKVKSL